jgi:serine/threonine-protein kinase
MSSPREEAPELPEGTRLLDRYSIIDRSGAGGMASIHRAMDERLDRVVCVKLLRLVLTGDGSTAGGHVYRATYSHFLQEAMALSKLQHPNTLRIYDFGYLEDGRPFQISEWLDGGNLEAHVRHRGAFSGDEIVAILERICGAISEAHSVGILHRDIKPSNILFARVGEHLLPKLADFGISQTQLKKQPRPGEQAAADAKSMSTVALFSPRWAAPEQLCGAAEGPATDVYALGLLAHFMIVGRPLFDDQDVRVTFEDRVRGDTLVGARLSSHGIKGDVLRVLRAALRADPNARIPDAVQFFEQIRTALGIGATSLPPPVVPRRKPPAESVTLEIESVPNVPGITSAPAPERFAQFGERRVRFVKIDEKLDFTMADDHGGELRFRVTMLPARNSINVKGLTCFVAKKGQRPTPAVAATADGTVEFVSTSREVIGGLTWSFGRPVDGGRVFLVDGAEMMVPYEQAPEAVALHISKGKDLIILYRGA